MAAATRAAASVQVSATAATVAAPLRTIESQACGADPADAEEAEAGQGGAHRTTTDFTNPAGRALHQRHRLVERVERQAVGDERFEVEPPRGDRLRGRADPGQRHLRIALVGVDHVDPPPVPQLHVDAAQAVLVVAGDDEPPAQSG